MPDMDDDKGTSVVLVHTEKGKAWFDNIKQNMVIRESDVDIILPPMSGGRHSVALNPKREKFFELLNQDASIDSLAKLVEEPLIKRIIRYGKTVIKRILKRILKK